MFFIIQKQISTKNSKAKLLRDLYGDLFKDQPGEKSY